MPLPNDIACERAFLSMLLKHPAYIQRYEGIIRAEDFYRDGNARIYASLLRLSKCKDKPADVIGVVNDLRGRGELQKAGGISEVTAIQQYAVSEQVGHSDEERTKGYAEIILECSRRRDGYRVFQEAAERAVSGEDLENLLAVAREHLPLEGAVDEGMRDASRLIDGWTLWFAETLEKGETPGIESGFPALDRLTGGWQDSTLIILGARPNMGKTALALNFAANACNKGKSVAFFSLEMTANELVSRIVSSEGHVEAHHASVPALMTREENDLSHNVLEKMRGWKIHIDDSYSMPVSKILARARKIQRAGGLDLVVIDHLNYIGADGTAENRTNEMRKITAALKGMAKELKIPVIVLCQLSRAVENRQDKRPNLSDLRESGTIEQDADIVLLLYRDGYYTRDENDKSAELQIAKHRNGATGTIQLRFDGEHQRFTQSDVSFWGRLEKGGVPM